MRVERLIKTDALRICGFAAIAPRLLTNRVAVLNSLSEVED